MRPAKAQTSLRICAVWSEPLLVAWIFSECYTTDWTSFGVSKLKRGLHRLDRVYTCQNATLLEISCRGSKSYSCDLEIIWIKICRNSKLKIKICWFGNNFAQWLSNTLPRLLVLFWAFEKHGRQGIWTPHPGLTLIMPTRKNFCKTCTMIVGFWHNHTAPRRFLRFWHDADAVSVKWHWHRAVIL